MQKETSSSELKALLIAEGVVSPAARLETLAGGVSSEIVRVVDGDTEFVAKRALNKLRVEAEWYANLDRNRYEHLYMEAVSAIVPASIPRVTHVNDDQGYFCMQWLGEGWHNWKTLMLAGDCQPETATEAARILGTIHQQTTENQALAETFAADQNFFELRLDPYLNATAEKHPELRKFFNAEVKRIRATKDGLVHGDFSPKNILVKGDGIMLLDCEVACYGDTSFDLAFLLNHLLLKGIYHAPKDAGLEKLFHAAVNAYFKARHLAPEQKTPWDQRVAHLLPMLLLARVDGKSPAEYLAEQEEKQDFIRDFVSKQLTQTTTLTELGEAWFKSLSPKFS